MADPISEDKSRRRKRKDDTDSLCSCDSVKLAPIEGEKDSYKDTSPWDQPMVPNVHGPTIHPSRGGKPSPGPSKDTTISIPEGGDSDPQHSTSAPQHRGNAQSGKAIETIVYLMDKTGLHFTVDDGQGIVAGELFEYVREELKLPTQAREVFSLWLVSDLLEVQLKPQQVPFKLACYWDELLEKYSSAPEEDIERDEPILMFQRNVFCQRSVEKQVTDPEMLRLLYCEAKENIVDARYPLAHDDCFKMAGMQCLIEQKYYDPNVHSAEFYKDKLRNYLPEHFTRKKWSMIKKDTPEEKLSCAHNNAQREFGQNIPQHDNRALVAMYKKYLEICWKLPYYGAAFFRGQVEHPGVRLSSQVDDPVFIAINTEGVFVIDMDDVEFLLGLLFKDLKWEFAEPQNSSNRNCMPCLFLQFNEKEKGANVVKVLQIFSREAQLMDAALVSLISLKNPQLSSDETDGSQGADEVDGVIKPEGEAWNKFSRLCLATFKGGKPVGNTMRKPKKKK